MEAIVRKQQFFDLYPNELWNSFRQWQTREDLKASGFDGLLGIRFRVKCGQPYFHHKTVEEALEIADSLNSKGIPDSDFMFFEASPDEKIVMQGEIKETETGLFLMYSCHQSDMRTALAKGTNYAHGLDAYVILQQVCSGSDWDDLRALLEIFPDHVLEFTTYDSPVGRLSGRNTVFWEIRSY